MIFLTFTNTIYFNKNKYFLGYPIFLIVREVLSFLHMMLRLFELSFLVLENTRSQEYNPNYVYIHTRLKS